MLEYWDLLDDKGNTLPGKMLRGSRQPENTWHAVVGIVIQNSQGRVLFVQRASCKEQFPDLWEHIGGCVRAGETVADAARREVLEEIGICFSEKELLFLDRFFEKTAYVHTFLIHMDFAIEDCVLQKEEVQGAKWVHLPEYLEGAKKDQISAAARRRLQRIVQYII